MFRWSAILPDYIIIIVGVAVHIGEQIGAERADVAVAVHPADVLVALGLADDADLMNAQRMGTTDRPTSAMR